MKYQSIRFIPKYALLTRELVGKALVNDLAVRGWSSMSGDCSSGNIRVFDMVYLIGPIEKVVNYLGINKQNIPDGLMDKNWILYTVIDDEDFDPDNKETFVYYHNYIAPVNDPNDLEYVVTFKHDEIGYWDGMFESMLLEKSNMERAIKELTDRRK